MKVIIRSLSGNDTEEDNIWRLDVMVNGNRFQLYENESSELVIMKINQDMEEIRVYPRSSNQIILK